MINGVLIVGFLVCSSIGMRYLHLRAAKGSQNSSVRKRLVNASTLFLYLGYALIPFYALGRFLSLLIPFDSIPIDFVGAIGVYFRITPLLGIAYCLLLSCHFVVLAQIGLRAKKPLSQCQQASDESDRKRGGRESDNPYRSPRA